MCSVCQTVQSELRLCNGRCGAARDAYFVVGWGGDAVCRGERMGRYVLDVYFCLLITYFAFGQQQRLTVHSIQVLWEWVRVYVYVYVYCNGRGKMLGVDDVVWCGRCYGRNLYS